MLLALFIFLFIIAIAASIYFLFDTWIMRILFLLLSFEIIIIIAQLTEYFITYVIFAE